MVVNWISLLSHFYSFNSFLYGACRVCNVTCECEGLWLGHHNCGDPIIWQRWLLLPVTAWNYPRWIVRVSSERAQFKKKSPKIHISFIRPARRGLCARIRVCSNGTVTLACDSIWHDTKYQVTMSWAVRGVTVTIFSMASTADAERGARPASPEKHNQNPMRTITSFEFDNKSNILFYFHPVNCIGSMVSSSGAHRQQKIKTREERESVTNRLYYPQYGPLWH